MQRYRRYASRCAASQQPHIARPDGPRTFFNHSNDFFDLPCEEFIGRKNARAKEMAESRSFLPFNSTRDDDWMPTQNGMSSSGNGSSLRLGADGALPPLRGALPPPPPLLRPPP